MKSRVTSMLGVIVFAAAGSAGCTDNAATTVTTVSEPPRLVVENLSCQDFYPGIPGSVAHWVQASGRLANPDSPPLQNVELKVVITRLGGVVAHVLEPDGPEPGALNVPSGSSVPFHASKDMTEDDPSLEGGTCRVQISVDGEPVATSGAVGSVVQAFYAP